MKKFSLIVLFAIPAITGWSLKNFNVNTPANFLTGQASPSNIFDFFNAHREGHGVAVLMWKSSSTAGVMSFQIERSYDGEFFDPVGGQSNNHAALYTWKDTNVLPGYLYYRVAANMSNGEIIYSDVAIIHIVQH